MELNQKTTAVPKCNKCGEDPTLEKRGLVGLVVTCDCDIAISVRVSSTLPEEWSQ